MLNLVFKSNKTTSNYTQIIKWFFLLHNLKFSILNKAQLTNQLTQKGRIRYSHNSTLKLSKFSLNALKVDKLIEVGVLNYDDALIKFKFKEDALFSTVYLRWLESWMGSPCCLYVQRNMLASYSAYHLICVDVLAQRMSYQTVGANKYNLGIWQKAPDSLYSAMLYQEPSLALAWLQNRMAKMPLQSHRKFFRLLAFYFAGFTKGNNPLISGVSMYVVGKISVTGNAMSRAQFIKTGAGSPANMQRQSATGFTLINTVTGCLGFSLTFYY